MTNLKNLNMGNKITKLTIEHESTEKSLDNHDEIMAIAILLGGYNEFGRKIPIEDYQEIKEIFNDCIKAIKMRL